MLTLEQLIAIMPHAKARAAKYLAPLNSAMQEFGINTPLRMAAFLAQIGHESGQLRYVREIASGAAYEGRRDLGNNQRGDGVRFAGRGLIQVTGRLNYTRLMMALDIDCVERPEIVEEPINACRSAAWFWSTIEGNKLADKEEFLKISIKINGRNKDGMPNGWKDRVELYERAKKVLNVEVCKQS